MKKNLSYLGVVTCLLTSGLAKADTDYIYNIHLPNITGGTESDGTFTQYPFSWIGPLKFNAGAGTDCPTLCGPPLGTTVNSNYFFDGFTFTADLGLSDAEAEVKFANFSNHSDTIIFSFIEPDSFWSTLGTGLSFPTATLGEGGTFSVDGGTSIVCNECTVDISTVTTPEPRSSILLGLLVGAAGLVIERRRRQLKAIG
jgi:hypothetical protein